MGFSPSHSKQLQEVVFSRKLTRHDILLSSSITRVTRVPPAGNYVLKVNNRNTRARCEIYSKLTIKTPERRQNTCARVSFFNKVADQGLQLY